MISYLQIDNLNGVLLDLSITRLNYFDGNDKQNCPLWI